LLVPVERRERVREPEAAREEDALAGREPIHAGLRLVAEDESVAHQLALNRLDGLDDPRILRGKEAHLGNEEEGRVEGVAAVELGEGPSFRVPCLLADLGADAVAYVLPAIHRSVEAELLRHLHRTVERDP